MIPKRFFEAVVAQMPSAVAVVEAPSGKTIIANDRSAEIWRRTSQHAREDVAGYGEYVGFAADGRRLRPEEWPLARSLMTGEVVRGEEVEIERGDGTRGFIRIHSAPVYDDEGTMIAAVVIFDDVTDRRELLAKVQGSERELALVTDAVPALVSFIDKDLVFRFMNRAYETWFDVKREECLGKPMGHVLGAAAVAALRPHIERALSGELVTFEATVPYRAGGTRQIRASYTPRRDGNGVVQGFAALVEDVSHHKRALDGIRLISEASRLLASSLDVRITLTSLAGLIVPRLGDWCAIDVVNDSGSPEQLAVHHIDPKKVELARELRRSYPPGRTGGLADVLRFGKSQLLTEIPEGAIAAAAQDADHLALLKSLDMKSSLTVPLRARGRILGAISLVAAESGRRFGEEDLALVEELAARASLAIDNARLFESERASRLALEAANQRLRILSDASRGFARHSRDIEQLLSAVCHTLLEVLADTVTVNIIAADGQALEQVALVSKIPEVEDYMRRMVVEQPMKVGQGVLGRVVQYGEPLFLPTIDREALRATVHPAYREIFDKTTATSLMVVPLRARDRVVGCISCARASGRAFDAHDLELLVELADRAALALENADLYQRMQKAVHLRDEFLSVASHELKTPLTTLTLQISSVLRAAGAHESATVSVAQLKKLDRQLQRMNDLVARLLDVSRIAGGRLQLELDDADVGDIVNEVASRFAEQARAQGSDLTVMVHGDTRARCDSTRVDQVITNLITNALKFGAHKPVRVVVDGAARADDVEVTVHDQGHGIAPEDQARIFERFERASSARNYGGMGLGLWITKQIVEAHGGAVSVSSALDKGAVFTVTLPKRPAAVQSASDAQAGGAG